MSDIKIYIAKNDGVGSDIVWQREKGKELLKRGLNDLLQDDKFVPNVQTSKSGKPYLANSDFHFNISHSQRYVVCAISEEEVGIDIQFHKKRDIDTVARRVMSTTEWQMYQAASDRVKFFYDLWAKKESYLKFTGMGIRSDLRLLDIEACVKEVSVDAKYSCMLCTQRFSEYSVVEWD